MVCGIYLIRCEQTGKCYVGSSKDIHYRWRQHRQLCRKGKSPCTLLQRAWLKHGEAGFSFHILEECPSDNLEAREQHFIDQLNPEMNVVMDTTRHVSDEHVQRLVAFNRARFKAITHCPRGHAYDDKNTYINKKGKRICRQCNADRVAAIYASETPEQRAKRLAANGDYFQRNKEVCKARIRAYGLAHREEKREYDRQRRARINGSVSIVT